MGERCEIGRDAACQVTVSGRGIARRHSLIWKDHRHHWLVDLDSRTGTWLDDRRVEQPCRLRDGMRIRVGSKCLHFSKDKTGETRTPFNFLPRELSRQMTTDPHIATGMTLVQIGLDGTIIFIAPEGLKWLAEFWPQNRRSRARSLPPALRNWLREPQSAASPCIQTKGDRRLVVRRHDLTGACVLSLAREESVCSTFALARFGLSEREREVLRWIAAGKRDADIATILGLSRRTVEKHVQRLLDHLNVESRSAAVGAMLGLLGCLR